MSSRKRSKQKPPNDVRQLRLPGVDEQGVGRGKSTTPFKLSTVYPQPIPRLSTGNATPPPQVGSDKEALSPLPYDDDEIQIQTVGVPPPVPVPPPFDITSDNDQELEQHDQL